MGIIRATIWVRGGVLTYSLSPPDRPTKEPFKELQFAYSLGFGEAILIISGSGVALFGEGIIMTRKVGGWLLRPAQQVVLGIRVWDLRTLNPKP